MSVINSLIPAIVFAIPITAIITKHRVRMAELKARSAPDAEERLATTERLRALEDRVRVLERIVTEPGQSLASEIEALRTPPAYMAPETRQQNGHPVAL